MISPTGKEAEHSGFTLIEILIVVAIIGILAAIAIPNFLMAQTRAKVAAAKADMASITTALEAYAVDYNDYPPNDGVFNTIPKQITTPIDFISTNRLIDPFSSQLTHPVYGNLARLYTYTKIVSYQEMINLSAAGISPPIESVDHPFFNEGAFEIYGKWRMLSNGPDKQYSDFTLFAVDYPLYGADVLYDPTNGTISWGNIIRTQKIADGIVITD
jgi:general secretion pathway protein G